MIKELTPLDAFYSLITTLTSVIRVMNKENLDIIETALKDKEKQDLILNFLKEHEWLKNTKIVIVDKKISDDDLEKLKCQSMIVSEEQCEIKPLFDEETLKKLKALEIIKKKKIDWSHFYRLLLDKRFDEKSDIQKVKILNKYNEYGKKITIKEFDLLKEVLK